VNPAALSGKKILITRAAGTSDEFAAKLREAGAEALPAPVIAIGPPDDEAGADLGVRIVETYAWIVFTSQNGVNAFFERVWAHGDDARALGDTRVAAIGPKTAESLLRYGIRADFVPARFTGDEVAAGLLERTLPGDRISLYCAQDFRDTLAGMLREGERSVDVYPAYKTSTLIDPRIAGLAREADVWTFASESSVRGLLANLPDAAALSQEKSVVCIGPVTAEAARAAGLVVSAVAEDSTLEGLLETLFAASA
jgi:uroporphyrinogen III methyltransferase / synthase